jgi:O-antigen ligase/tetratricopeptide (TPR) repeat protein
MNLLAPSSKKGFFDVIIIGSQFFLIASISLSFSSTMAFPFSTLKQIYLEGMVIFIMCLMIIRFAQLGELKIRLNFLDLSILLRVILLLFLFLFAPSYGQGGNTLWIITLLTVFYFGIQNTLDGKRIDIKKWSSMTGYFIVLTGIIEIAIVGRELFRNVLPATIQYYADKPQIQGTLGNPNIIGGYLASCIPFYFSSVKSSRSRYLKGLIVLALVATIVFVVLTRSRGSWLGLIAGTAVYYSSEIAKWVKSISRMKTIILSAATLAVGYSAIIALININPDSARGRIYLWKITGEMILDSPVMGIGLGNYGTKYLDYQGDFFSNGKNSEFYGHTTDMKHALNEYLEIFAETGMIGLTVFLFIIYGFVSSSIRLIRNVSTEGIHVPKEFIASGATILVHSLVAGPLQVIPINLMLFLSFSVASFCDKENYHTPFPGSKNILNMVLVKTYNPTFTKPVKWGLTCLGIAVFGISVDMILGKAIAYSSWQTGLNYSANERWGEAIKCFRESEKRILDDGRLQFNIGAAYLNLDDSENAIKYLSKANYSTQGMNGYIELCIAFLRNKDYSKAEQTCKDLAYRFPDRLLPHLLLGKVYLENHHSQQAIVELDHVLNMSAKFDNDYSKTIINEAKTLKEKIRQLGLEAEKCP